MSDAVFFVLHKNKGSLFLVSLHRETRHSDLQYLKGKNCYTFKEPLESAVSI